MREKKGGNYYIVMNLGKTMEMVIDFRQMKPNYAPIMIKGEVFEQVNNYHYLGSVIDFKVAWH